jgi:hypothetical protein
VDEGFLPKVDGDNNIASGSPGTTELIDTALAVNVEQLLNNLDNRLMIGQGRHLIKIENIAKADAQIIIYGFDRSAGLMTP